MCSQVLIHFFFFFVNKYIDQKNEPPTYPSVKQKAHGWPKQDIQHMKEQGLSPKQDQQKQIPPPGPDRR